MAAHPGGEPSDEVPLSIELLENDIKNGVIHYIDYNDFTDSEIIGKGAFSSVSKAQWTNAGLIVAFKSLEDYSEGKPIKAFIKEVWYN
ncbi:kinase-like protein [Gigaspora margarita]|uniref:Kinase-like protein n=1 Tax=Gigaspora margarita TaxID=4874 RepID=A0A8H4AJ39_GIGMA|nr:kinase-like protein [Gigaspora margarita]